MVLLRRVIGDALRARRQGQHRTLREVSTAANVSLGYLSEIERGQKEASSELLASICDALGARLSELLREVSDTVALAEQLPPVLVPVQERSVDQPDSVGRERQKVGSSQTHQGQTAVRVVTDRNTRKVAADSKVSVRPDSPRKATLRATHHPRSAERGREVVCAA